MYIETVLLSVSAALTCTLGAVVLFRNPTKTTHRLFAVLSANLALWTLGVLAIIHCHTLPTATFWIRATFIVAVFLPATYYHFTVYFPHQRFEGVRSILVALYAGGVLQVIGSFTPWYIKSIRVSPDQPPQVFYGPVFSFYLFWILLAMLFMFSNLFIKLRMATGVERRQVEHVMIGITLATILSTTTNVLAPVLDITSAEIYGPIFTLLLMGFIAYAMIRYHLMDIWWLVSRTTVYAVTISFTVAVFLGMFSLVHLIFSGHGTPGLLSTLPAALVIVLVLQPLKERLQILMQRTILKRHYDVNRFCAQISKKAARFMRPEQLLDSVAREIRTRIGVNTVRVWLVDEKEPGVLTCQYSTVPEDIGRQTNQHAALLEYLNRHPDPIILRKLLHQRPTPERMAIAERLAELDAYLCVPLWASSKIIGILTLDEKISGDIYSSDDITVFTTIAGPLGTAIENSRLYAKLEEVNLHLARILSSMRGGVVAVDKQGKVTTFNASAAGIFGPLEVGQDMSDLRPELAQVLCTTLEEERGIGDFEMVVTGSDGESVPVVISSSCLQVPGSGICGAMAMIHDLTQIKRLEQNVQRADRLSSIGTLAAGMAHEVKNPLVSIKTFTQLLLKRFDDVDFRKTFAEVVPHEVERIDTIVSRLLDFARPKPVHFAEQDLVKIVNAVLALVENQLRKYRVHVTLEHPRDPVNVYGDEQQLHQVFLNLFLNAVDAMKETQGGRLSVRIRYDRTRLQSRDVAPYVETECVQVVVADTGCGIAKNHLHQLFTPFFTTKAEGCGLGLSVVHGIVTEHGGEIDVESTPGVGTTFSVRFPLNHGALSVNKA